jgi:hypothetical protein
MTISRSIFTGSTPARAARLIALALAGSIALGGAGSALAWQQQKPGAQPSPQTQPQPSLVSRQAAEDFKQTVKQQQLNDQLQKNRLENQLQKNTQKTALAPSAKNSSLKAQFDDADQARDQHYRANQQDLLDRYKNAATPRVAPPLPQPANPPPTLGQ